MPIDTRIDGNPADIQRVADWIRATLGSVVDRATDDAGRARRIADDGWDGTASGEFLTTTSNAISAADRLHTRVLDVARRHESTSAQLATALGDMATVRESAAAAGLAVVDTVIGDPHTASDQALRDAYETARTAAQDIHHRWADAVAALTDTWADEAWAASFIAGAGLDLHNNELGRRIRVLTARADELSATATRAMQAVIDLPDGTPYAQVRRSFGAAQSLVDDVAGAARSADDLTRASVTLGRAAAGATLIAGIGIDYYGGGESLEQAVVSNGAGLAASIGAGAAAGLVIGSIVPGAGNALGSAVGAAVGAVSGIAASGIVDDLYENGARSVRASAGAGWNELISAIDAVGELGGATVGGVARLGRGIAGVFS